MKFNTVSKEVQSFGEISKKKISISANAKAYRLIFGQIYPDIIKAIVRELFTNAWDSQKVANNLETPIDIHLPSKWEPYFGIRDYGTGMTPDVIDKIYSNVFESSKDQSNDEAGMFGMGSKTPLGYVDTFSIVSYVNGTYWYYDIHMDDSGSAVISLKATGETTEPNGVDVQVAVLEKDFEFFNTHVQHFAYGANTPINVNREKFLNIRKIFKEGNGWYLYEKSDKKAQETVHIRMGCVLYALRWNYIEKKIDYYEKNKIQNLLSKPFVLDYPIGTFAVTGSREDIIYNDESCKLIVDRLSEIAETMAIDSAIDIQNSNSYYDAWKKYIQYINIGFYPNVPKYGALKLSAYVSNIKGLEFFYDVFKNKRLSKTTKDIDKNSNSFTLQNLYPPTTYNVTTYKKVYYVAVDKNNVPNNISKRLANLTNSFEKYNLILNKKSYQRNAEIVLVYYTDIRRLNRLFVYLPNSGKCNTVVVKIEDIEPYKAPKLEKEQSKIINSYFVNLTKYNIEVSYNRVKIENGDFYVNVSYKSFIDSENLIRKAATYFQNKLKDSKNSLKILAIKRSEQKAIKDYNLVNLMDEYNKEMNKISYNDDTYSYFALKYIIGTETIPFAKNPDFLQKYLPKYIKEFKDVDVNFDPDANENVKKRFQKEKEEIQKVLIDFLEKHPIMKYIDPFSIVNNFAEIEKLI